MLFMVWLNVPNINNQCHCQVTAVEFMVGSMLNIPHIYRFVTMVY
jgi:hypothetical protein